MSVPRDLRRLPVSRAASAVALLVVAVVLAGPMLERGAPIAGGPDGSPAPVAVAGRASGRIGPAPAGRAAGVPPAARGAPGSGAGAQAQRAQVGIPDPAVRGAPRTIVPRVVRFRPRDGWTGVGATANLSVRFTLPMDHASTERAFSAIAADGDRIAGSFGWAEGDTVLVLDPSRALPHGTRVRLEVSEGALSVDGVALAQAASATFSVRSEPGPTRTPSTSAGWRWPLVGPITQYFGQSLTRYGLHQGIDIDGDTGDPVRAAHAGRVTVAGRYDQCGGLEVHVDHGGGVVSWYRHLSRIDVRAGEAVSAGTIVGRVGNTGCSLGSHLHFAIRVEKTFVDPLRYLPRR